MSFAMYMIGVAILLGGLIYGAILLNVPTQWIVVGAAIVVGIGILAAVKNTRRRDPSE
ncbi:MAG: hypothetical protein R3F12_06745 [Lysobacteraceae bacterium]|nr:hypothetical protein [Xanthomonadaceae bacterium]HRX99907.1 hypothetical protein [Xanthomonadaceae bacterium]